MSVGRRFDGWEADLAAAIPDTATRFEAEFGREAARAWGLRPTPLTVKSILIRQFYDENPFLTALAAPPPRRGLRDRLWRWLAL